ncbi:hypothetical protein VNO80_06675 [Phaseolus coccineus]|uniref:Uncharacterized protein n=1 Tax=Phaseolus coccineus TaxID=3886 RepID=A0AAN9NH96_PHACN
MTLGVLELSLQASKTLLDLILRSGELFDIIGGRGGEGIREGEFGAWEEGLRDSIISTRFGGPLDLADKGEPKAPEEIPTTAILLFLGGLKSDNTPLSREGAPFWD